MNRSKRIYLDHAATSWPKTEAVLSVMDHFHRTEGASAGRSAYASATRANAWVSDCRRRIANMIGAPDHHCVSFHCSGTAALNAAIHGLLRPGDHVVTTAVEHNSVLRPLKFWQTYHNVSVTIVPCDNEGKVDAAEVLDAVQSDTRMVAVTHVSNVTGAMQPIQEIGLKLQHQNIAFLCDAAQSFGYIPINVSELNVDLLAAPGHKGGAGPLGTAMLFCDPQWHSELRSTIQGGTGSQSESLWMPDSMPDKLEAGNLNVPAIVGWNAGLTELGDRVHSTTADRLRDLATSLYTRLSQIPHVHVIGSPGLVPLVSLSIDGLAATDAAAILDSEFAIETRAGYHCAALIHEFIGTQSEGTLRISAGRETTNEEIDAVVHAIKELALEINP